MSELAQVGGGFRFGNGGRFSGGKKQDPARGNLGPSHSVDQKYDKKLEGRTMGARLEELSKFANSPRDVKSKVAPYASQISGITFNQRTSRELRLKALQIVVKLGRAHAAPSEQDLPRLAKDKDPEIAKAAKAAIEAFKKQPKPANRTPREAPLRNFRFFNRG